MIRNELPKPNHRFKDEVGKKKRFAEGGLVINATFMDDAMPYLIEREFIIPRASYIYSNKLVIVFPDDIIKFAE